MNLRKLALPLAAMAFLSGCGGVDLVEAGKPADLGNGISVTPTTAWGRVHSIGMDPVLTIDGMGLNEVHYYTGIKPGNPIFSVSGVSDKEVGLYQANMLPNDIMDLLVANLSKSGNQDVRASNLAPAHFGAANGFRFDVAYVTKDGLDMQGEALMAQRGGKLDVLLFVAPQEFYYAHRKPDVDQLFTTLQASA